MIYGLLPRELHEKLLDHDNHQNRINGIEELKRIMCHVDLETHSVKVTEFIIFLHKLLDDCNFKVYYGTLQVMNLLVRKLDYDVDQYYKQIIHVVLKTLGDTRAALRNEYMNVFRQLMRIVRPQNVLDLVAELLKHRNPRVREDILNIITAAMLTYPKTDFDIQHLCFVVALCLADKSRKVRHAALELFAVFDHCLDTGKKQPIMKAIDAVELTGDAKGLMAAVQARSSRDILPRLSADGTVEYALVIPKPGHGRTPHSDSGDDLDWILNARSMSGSSYDIPLQRMIESAGKTKFPWDMLRLPSGGDQETRNILNETSDKVRLKGLPTSMKLDREISVTESAEPLQFHVSGQRRKSTTRLRPNGQLNSTSDNFIAASCDDAEREAKPAPQIRQIHQCVTAEVASDEAASLKELQLNGAVLPVSEPEALREESPTNPMGAQGPKNSQRFDGPQDQLESLKSTLPHMRRASDKITPVTQKDPSEQVDLPLPRPELALEQSFELLDSEDCQEKIKGLNILRCLARYHSDVLSSKLRIACVAIIQKVRNLRSGVSRIAVEILGELYSNLQKGMDQELDLTVKVLLHKAGETNVFIRQDVDAALDSMVQNCTPKRSLNALLAGGLDHLNAVVRKCTAQHLSTLVEKIGTERLFSGTEDLIDRLVPAVSKFALDSAPEPRYFGRQMLLFLSSHQDFDKMVEKYIPAKDLEMIRNIVATLKTKGLAEMHQDVPTRGRRTISSGGLAHASSASCKPQFSSRKLQCHNTADKTRYVKQLSVLLSSRDFRERIMGIDQLVADCEENPNIVMGSMLPVFDAFKERLLESNSKVNLYALEALQKIITLLKDNMAQVIYILIPAVVDNHLNSRNNSIYTAAMGVIWALINNLDNSLLLQPFCTGAQLRSGKAKLNLIDLVAELVSELYSHKPQLVQQKVLPLLWHLLGSPCKNTMVHSSNGTMKGAITNLCHALYAQMGQLLQTQAASQPSHILINLNKILHTLRAC